MGSFLREIYKNKKVLVTGHTGFKGGWLALWLKELGANVTGYSLSPPTEPSFFESIGLQQHILHVTGDIRDEKNLLSTFQEHQPEFVFHLAAQPLVLLSYKEPKLTYETNVMGTINVLEAVRQTKSVRACVIITSDKCYENKEWVYGYRETDPMGGYDPYSSSKGCAELVTASYAKSFFNHDSNSATNVTLSSVRAGNVIGGGDWAADRIVPDCIKALASNQKITIRNPFATRPWQYVLEPLGGYLLLGALMRKYGSKYSGPWNFGPNDASVITVEELVKFVIKNWGYGGYVVDESSSFSHEAHFLKLDTSKAQIQLGWKPICDINQTVAQTITWYRKFYDGSNQLELYDASISEIRKYTTLMSKAIEHVHGNQALTGV